MRPKKRKEAEEYNFWQPTADMMSALILVLLLIILTLILCLVILPKHEGVDDEYGYETTEEYIDDEYGDHTEPYTERYSEPSETTEAPTRESEVYNGDDDGNGDDNGNEPGDEPGDEPGYGDGIKTAVYVMLVDAETDRTVKEEGVTFELYAIDEQIPEAIRRRYGGSSFQVYRNLKAEYAERNEILMLNDQLLENGFLSQKGELQILNTYYPEKITYRNFATMENGTFYLPEKIFQGTYYFHEITEASGYDMADNQYFEVYDMFDWPEPFVVHIPVYPSRNVIRVQMNDAESGLSIPGGTFTVKAAEDIVTLDGSLRYRRGEIVDEIVCDEHGYGESIELYLGKYRVTQKTIPDYYASIDEPFDVTVEKKTNVQPELHTLLCDRSTIHMVVSDELYESIKIEGAEFSVSYDGQEGGPDLVTTNAAGELVLDSLVKDTTYHIKQVSSVDDYHTYSDVISIAVDADGRMEGEPISEMEIPNRLLRVTFGVVDALLGDQLNGKRLSLYDKDENLIQSWTTAGRMETMTDLKEGTYYLVVGEDMNNKQIAKVENTPGIQEQNAKVLTAKGVLTVSGIGAAAAGGIAVLIIFLVRRSKMKKRKAA